jgi:hypothetical protein
MFYTLTVSPSTSQCFLSCSLSIKSITATSKKKFIRWLCHHQPRNVSFLVRAASSQPQQQPGHPPQVFDDATSEIADIDTRLHALQNFLKMAKSSGGRAA